MTDLSQPASAGTEPLALRAGLKASTTAAPPPVPAAGAVETPLCLPRELRKPRLRRWEASQYLELVHGIPVAPATLAKWASVGGGPEYQKVNRTALYTRGALDIWAAAKLTAPVKNTSQVVR